MNKLAPLRFGLGLGTAWSVFYVLCILTMRLLPHETTVWLFNLFFHGLDVASIMRWDIPWWESALSVLVSFAAGWLCGVALAVVYNVTLKKEPTHIQ
ncbi:DUF5676 family membrane protein [Novipirellula artificiosorum]|uniref:Uncharacterized protein n=1 Tax=Novipirellula artificiosorum TaxID=2528016 RepID=A0A5C6DWJ0_9BACT|nr:DUF5676 family membrane protein [Novipirellula artificiosorum]TWU39426.1 hypothetical protein Poly41_22500 [Novipirellula artificiosorum]